MRPERHTKFYAR